VLPNSPDLNPVDYHVGGGATLESYYMLQPKPKTSPELKDALQLIWSALQQKSIDNAAVRDFRNLMQTCVLASG